MAIEITPELASAVQNIYAGGEYAREGDVLAAALRLLQQREQLRRDLLEGVAELQRGERLDGEQVFSDLRLKAARLDGQGA